MSKLQFIDTFKAKHPVLFHSILAFIVLLAGIYACLLLTDVFTNHGEQVRVPDVSFLPLQQAIEKLEDAGLEYEVDSIYNEELQQQLSDAEASYHNEQLKSENEAAEKRSRLILITSVIVALLLTGIIGMLIYAVRTRARSVKAMQRLQRARERFFTNVTHEFRTPLTVIMAAWPCRMCHLGL